MIMHIQKTFIRNIILLSAFPLMVAIVVFMMSVSVHAEEMQQYNTYTFITQQKANGYTTTITWYYRFKGTMAGYIVDNEYINLYFHGEDIYYSHYDTLTVNDSTGEETNNIGNEAQYKHNGNPVKKSREGFISTSIPIFKDIESYDKYIQNGDDSGQINKPIDFSSATYNSKIPIPKLVFNSKGGYKFSIANAVDGYYIQIKGRWYTVDDITLFKENLQWKYKYDTLLKGSLTEWVEPNEKILASAEHELCDYNCNGYGGDAFKALIASYPIDNRTYSGGKNALGDKISGYTDALTSLKDLHLKNPESAFNSPEIYIRFIVVNDDNSVQYGKWCHWYSNLANASGSSGFNLDDSDNVSGESQSYNGLTDDELNNNEQQENPRNDSDIYTYVNSDYIKQNIEISSDIANKTGAFFELLNSMFSAMGQFPQMFKDVFMFLPPWFINFIIISMGAIIIARFIGR